HTLAFRIGPRHLLGYLLDAIFHQRIQRELLVHVLEVVLLPPTPKQPPHHLHRGQVRSVGHDHGLPALLTQHRDLSQPQIRRLPRRPPPLPPRPQAAHTLARLIAQPVRLLLALLLHLVFAEVRTRYRQTL